MDKRSKLSIKAKKNVAVAANFTFLAFLEGKGHIFDWTFDKISIAHLDNPYVGKMWTVLLFLSFEFDVALVNEFPKKCLKDFEKCINLTSLSINLKIGILNHKSHSFCNNIYYLFKLLQLDFWLVDYCASFCSFIWLDKNCISFDSVFRAALLGKMDCSKENEMILALAIFIH